MRASIVMSGMAQGLRRNASMTIALVLNTAVALGFVGMSMLANKEIDKFRRYYDGKINVSVYLCTDPLKALPNQNPNCPRRATSAETAAIEKALRADPMVRSVTYVSPAQQAELARKTLPKDQVDALGPEFVWPASFTVKLHDTRRDYVTFAVHYLTMKGVDTIPDQWQVLKPILDVFDGARVASILLAVVVLVAAVLLMVNTIQVAAAQRRAETNIMRLVGASRWMTELPFILEAMVATFVGALIGAGLQAFAKWFALRHIFGDLVRNGIIPDLTTGDLVVAAGASMVVGVVLAMVTAFATLRLYVRL